MCLKTSKLKFLDITNYLAPGVSYAKFLKAFKCTQLKGFFPYEWVTSLDQLKQDHLPEHECFHSSLTNSNITPDEYRFCQNVWTEKGMATFAEYLTWYNNLDVEPFLQAISKMSAFYEDNDIDMFKDGISVPGLTMRYLFMTLEEGVYFTLFDEKNRDVHDLIKENIVGGPSLVFHRYHEVDETFIREETYGGEAKKCKAVLGFDANALYLNCLMQNMPTGNLVRRKEPLFQARSSHRFGYLAREWLDYRSKADGVVIRHQFNGNEKRVGARRLPVDGWCKETSTVYQFHGCFWHGHDCRLNKGKVMNEVRKKSMEQLREDTKQNSNYITNVGGYQLNEIWECEWEDMKNKNEEVKQHMRMSSRKAVNPWRKMTEEEILERVKDESFFGLVECDIRVPDDLKEKFSEMQPIFKNVAVSKDVIGEHMQDYANEHGYLKQPRRMLIGSFYGERILLATPLLKWYIEHGLHVTKIYQTFEYEPKKCFEAFGEKVSDARRAGDADPDQAIIADTMKLLGNSGYGKTVTNKDRHRDIKFTDTDLKASTLINEPLFRRLNCMSESLYELEMSKKKIKYDLPLHIGFFVYQYAKLRMLEFYYDFLDYYVDKKDFQYIEMDTDSAYLSISGKTLEQVVRPSLKRDFYENWKRWLPAEACEHHNAEFVEVKLNEKEWIPSDCCLKAKAFDKRTPGLFKIEWEGAGIVALNSKTYYCFGETSKLSCKGISKKQNDLRREDYMKVLSEKTAGGGRNKGFKVRNNKVYTYSQNRTGLSYFYPKRIVCADGISTQPIKI